MPINSLIFDFDGLILDTETAEIDAWKAIYAERGFAFPMARWAPNVGVWGAALFDPAQYLHELTNDSLDVSAVRTRHHDESAELILRQPILDGVQDYLTEAHRQQLRLAVASSSPHYWVDKHLSRLGLTHHFEKIVCGDDVPPGRTKPHPDIYLKALSGLRIRADEAIAFEDSPNGVKAARAAGLFVVAVPNPTTSLLNLDGADLTVNSLASVSLEDLLARVGRCVLKSAI